MVPTCLACLTISISRNSPQFSESLEIFEFELSVLLFGKTDPMRPLVFQVIHRMPSERKGPHPSQPVVRKRMKQRRDRQRRRIVQAARNSGCRGSLGTQKESRSLDNLVSHLWPQGIVLGLLPRIPRVWCCRCKYFAGSGRESRPNPCSRSQRRSRS